MHHERKEKHMENQMYPGWEALYALPDKHCIRIYNPVDDPVYSYGYDHFGADHALIDGGVFDPVYKLIICPEQILEPALEICGYPTDTPTFRLDDGSGPIDLEELGFTGF